MEIDKVFSNDVDGVADNLFSAVKNSVSEIKAMQQRKAAENVQLVIQALKKIESDLQDKFDGVTTVIEKRVSTIKDGRDGLDGRNGRDGKDGRPGRDGAPGARGPAGVPGTNGRDGEDGVSVTDARIDFDGSLVITLSDGREINVGEVVSTELAEKIKVTMSTNAALTVQDEGSTLTSGARTINFTGSGVTATASGDAVTVNITSSTISVTDYGAVGDWNGSTGTDNLAAFNACYAYALTRMAAGYGVKITIPAGRYRLSGEWNVYRASSPRRDLIIEGDDQLASILVADFAGADKALIRCVDPSGASRASPTSVFKLGFQKSSAASPCPVYLDVLGHGESRIEKLRFSSCDNTVMRIGSAQNVRMSDIVSFYGGKHFNYKATDGITFSTTSGGTTITASSSIFSADDVGKVISLYPTATENYIKYVITAYTSATQVTVSGTTLAATNVVGRFQPAQCSMTSGSATLTANASVFSASDVGRVIYVRNARAGSWGNALLRAKISSYTSATQVTLDTAATATITDQFFCVPVIDLYRPAGAGAVAASPNDVKIDNLHIENYTGVGLVAQDVVFHHITNFKIHGEVTPLDTFASLGMMWLDDFAGELTGEFDGVCTGDTRFYACNFNDMATIEWLATRRQRQETIFKTELFTDAGGYINVSNLNTYTADSTGTEGLGVDANFLADENDPRLVFSGFINMLGDSQKARIHTGRQSFFNPRGQLKAFRTLDDSVLSSSNVSWNGTAPSGTATLRYRWEQIANVVHFSMRLEYTVAGTSNSSVTVQIPSDMPEPADLFGNSGLEFAAGCITAAMATATTGVVPALTKNYMQGNGSGGYQVVCGLNSGTISANFATISGFYWSA